MSPLRLSSAPRSTATPIHRGWSMLLCMAVLLGLAAAASAQSGGAPINPIASFQVQEASTALSWSQTNAAVDPGTGNSVITFQDGNGGTSTMVWQSGAGTLLNWTVTLANGSTQTYSDGAGQGRIGGFALVGGTFGSNNVLSVNGHPYVPSGNLLVPSTYPLYTYITRYAQGMRQFTFSGSVYQVSSAGIDYLARPVGVYASGTATTTCIFTQGQGVEFGFADGSQASYAIDAVGRAYTYQPSSTAANLLTQIDGYPLKAAGNALLLPAPITSFVFDGITCTLNQVTFQSGVLELNYSGGSMVDVFVNKDGSVGEIDIGNDGNENSGGFGPSGGGAYIYQSQAQDGSPDPSFQITAINGVPYVWSQRRIVPRGPVGTFSYGGGTYQFTDSAQASDGNYLALYQSTGAIPQSATLEYSPASDALVRLSINAPGGGTATYVDGATVGQPGAYVWSSASTAANALSSVNNAAYKPAGNSDLPGTAQTANGVFQVEGNFLSLGSWSNDAAQSGFSLSYYDGTPVTVPASVEFTASRPLTAWLWDAATADGTNVTPVMQLDASSRLLLYPQGSASAAGGPATPAPAVILDPSAGNPSEFAGVVRFDGSVRVAPQGDLSMGAFTQDGFAAKPTQ